MSMLPLYPDSQKRWLRCERCRLYESRRNVVLYRTGYVKDGQTLSNHPFSIIDPTILFIGEAPGQQEDHTGLPFQERSGYILHQFFARTKTPFNFVITNLVGCRPTELGFRDQIVNREPTQTEQEACRPRIDDLLTHFEFEGVVYLGKLAQSYRTSIVRTLELVHPAHILRMEFKLYEIKRSAQALEKYVASIQKAKGVYSDRN